MPVYIGENPPPGMAAIYSLRETPDGPRRYIGSTSTNLYNRAHTHKMMRRFPIMVAEMFVPEAQKLEMEQLWIDSCRAEGIELANQINAVPKCGTNGGYRAHHKRGEKSCGACRKAHTEYVRNRKGRKPFQPADRCGTSSGYWAHRRRKESTCSECLEAYREHCRERRGYKPRHPARCGTNSGYNKHRRDGTPICVDCRTAHNDYCRPHNAKRRKDMQK